MDFSTLLSTAKTYILGKLHSYADTYNAATEEGELQLPVLSTIAMMHPANDRDTAAVRAYLKDGKYLFEPITNESEGVNGELMFYLIVGGYAQASARTIIAEFMRALYTAVKDDQSLGGAVGEAYITELEPFDGVEGQDNALAFKGTISYVAEIE